MGGKEVIILIRFFSIMDWDFTENIAFKALYEAFKDSDETSALEFLSSDGASYYLELTQDAAGEGLDLGDNETMEELQGEIIEYLEKQLKIQLKR